MPSLRDLVSGERLPAIGLVAALLSVVLAWTGSFISGAELPSFRDQFCSLPRPWRERIVRGYYGPRSGQISVLPRYPAYSGTAEGGWSHSGPWGYLQRVPLVLFGPQHVRHAGEVDRPVTVADIAPTLMRLMRASLNTEDARPLDEAVPLGGRLVGRAAPRLIVVVVWDGGGWNVLDRWPRAWPHLKSLMERGTSYTNAIVGSSPSVTPSVHTTLGTGAFPYRHGITGIPVRDEDGEVVDSFLKGESSRFIRVRTVAELWDEHNENRARIGMIGYEPWHLGMIGRGAEDPSGDKDDAVWLDPDTNEWITNADHYTLPEVVRKPKALQQELRSLDAADGVIDRAWGEHDILDDPDRIEETPAFISYHGRALRSVIKSGGYGQDEITDLLFTNFKQIDRLGHYFNMASDEVRQSLEETDRQLGHLVDYLDEEVGADEWAIVVTADHGQQPDAEVIEGYGIDPKEIARDIDNEFGAITRAVWPTEVFLYPDALAREGVAIEEVARFIGDYRLADNTQRPDMLVRGAGRFGPRDRIYAMAVPAAILNEPSCGA